MNAVVEQSYGGAGLVMLFLINESNLLTGFCAGRMILAISLAASRLC
jgi:hypothetical protein